MSAGEPGTQVAAPERSDQRFTWLLAGASALAVLIANVQGISIGDDGVGYRALADSLLNGQGYGYFLERPVTVWPPIWPSLMAAVSKVLPIGTVGAAALLNAVVAAAVVVVGNKLLRKVVTESRFVLLGTAVIALGPSTIGLGHVLMTDMAFALLMLVWMIVLTNFHERESTTTLVGAATLVWIGFGLRYIGLVLIVFGGLWLLLDRRKPALTRLRNGVIYGVVASLVPVAWMLRNHAIDGTFTGERHSSARGFLGNCLDLAATIGKFLLPGVGNSFSKPWALIGVAVTLGALWLLWRILSSNGSGGRLSTRATTTRALELLGTPIGLVAMFAGLYLTYMLYVRTTTALNVLDIRLLYPAYFPLVISALALATRVEWRRATWATVHVWAAANVAVGLIGMIAFGLGNPYFKGDYANDTFETVRANPVLNKIPSDCKVYSNLPNALYPRVDSKWSPEQTALESFDKTDDLARIIRESAKTDVCLVWIDEEPLYWHLWTLDELESRLTLTPIAANGDVDVFKVSPPS